MYGRCSFGAMCGASSLPELRASLERRAQQATLEGGTATQQYVVLCTLHHAHDRRRSIVGTPCKTATAVSCTPSLVRHTAH